MMGQVLSTPPPPMAGCTGSVPRHLGFGLPAPGPGKSELLLLVVLCSSSQEVGRLGTQGLPGLWCVRGVEGHLHFVLFFKFSKIVYCLNRRTP